MAQQQPLQQFYALTPDVRERLLEAKLTAAEWRMWAYLVSLDPYGDRGAKFSASELMLHCSIKKTAYFKAKAKFQKLGLFNFQDGTTKVINLYGYRNHQKSNRSQSETHHQFLKPESRADGILDFPTKSHSSQQTTVIVKPELAQQATVIKPELAQQATVIENNYSQQAILIESANAESQSVKTESQSVKTDSESASAESQSLKPLPSRAATAPQKVQTIQTPQTEPDGGNENKNKKTWETNGSELTKLSVIIPEVKVAPNPSLSEPVEMKLPLSVIQESAKCSGTKPISDELIAKLGKLNIPLDQAVRKAIASYHPSQVQGALTHIEATWGEIRNPKSVFLYQVSRQPIQKTLKNPLSPEFLEWYNEAVAQGVVQERLPESLPLNHLREPMVYLADGQLLEWRKVQRGEYSPLTSPEQVLDFFARMKARLLSKRTAR